MTFHDWRLTHVLVLGATWVLLIVAILVVRLLSAAQRSDLGSISFRLASAAVLAFGPPLLVLLFWVLQRRR